MIETSLLSVHRTRPAMGTLFEVLLRGEDEEHLAAVADAILDEVQRIERLLSRFDPCSEISRINRLAAREPVLIDCELAALLQTCFEAQQWTGGAFDITASSRRGACRGAAAHITFDPTSRLIQLGDSTIQLDLGGNGKGYALDRAAALLDEYHVEHALLHGGTSSVLARGTSSEGVPWRIALPGLTSQALHLNDEALSCSAVDEQADIIDPITGEPVRRDSWPLTPSGPESSNDLALWERADHGAPVGTAVPRGARGLLFSGCAVVAPTATEAEIVSTALLCLNSAQAEALVDNWCTSNRSVRWLDTAWIGPGELR